MEIKPEMIEEANRKRAIDLTTSFLRKTPSKTIYNLRMTLLKTFLSQCGVGKVSELKAPDLPRYLVLIDSCIWLAKNFSDDDGSMIDALYEDIQRYQSSAERASGYQIIAVRNDDPNLKEHTFVMEGQPIEYHGHLREKVLVEHLTALLPRGYMPVGIISKKECYETLLPIETLRTRQQQLDGLIAAAERTCEQLIDSTQSRTCRIAKELKAALDEYTVKAEAKLAEEPSEPENESIL